MYTGCQIQRDTKIFNSNHDVRESFRACQEESSVCHTPITAQMTTCRKSWLPLPLI